LNTWLNVLSVGSASFATIFELIDSILHDVLFIENLSMMIVMPEDAGNFTTLFNDEQTSMKSKFHEIINDVWSGEHCIYYSCPGQNCTKSLI